MRTLTATIAAALGCILTAHAQVAVSPGYTPYMATVFLATNSTHARALLEVSSGTATNLAAGATGADLTLSGDLSVGGTLTVDEVDTDTLVITNSLTVPNMYVNTMVVTNAITGTNSGTFGTLLSVTNAAITWGVEAVTQSGGTNYTLPFAGTASYPNTYLAYTMTGNVCFAFTTNRAAGRCRTVILYGNGKKGRLDFNSDNHLIGTLANGIVVTNTFVLSFFTGGTDETNVFISGQYAE